MTQKARQLIVVSTKNYQRLRELGNVTDSFDDVVSKVLEIAIPVLVDRKKEGIEGPTTTARSHTYDVCNSTQPNWHGGLISNNQKNSQV